MGVVVTAFAKTKIIPALKSFVTWLVTSVLGKAIFKTVAKVSFMGLFLVAIAGAGLLPQSPLRVIRIPLTNMMMGIPYMRYISAFIPVTPIMMTLSAWLSAVVSFHILKVILRMGKIIK
ncbi:MAG: hypothetical protein FWB80_12545 [Defluviitaleaceae bacterium]|nr:hypothetical protein [Defluviitaleaceae bacterium]